MNSEKYYGKVRVGLQSALICFGVGWAVSSAAAVSQVPLIVSQSADPLVMLTMSKDHQLFYKAYNDYSDLIGTTPESDPDGTPETTYTHHFDYYGYFDSYTCYDYSTSSGRFVPQGTTADKYCDSASGSWSGNFLNWIAMTRMDVVRKVLYGGLRSTDTDTTTVLERAHLPTDAHSYAKYYNGADVGRLTPFGGDVTTTGGDEEDRGITFCNTTHAPDSHASHNTDRPPLIRVAKGNFMLWAANERWQCLWREERSSKGQAQNDGNSNDPAESGIPAHDLDPRRSSESLGEADYVARVEVCGASLYGNETETCVEYANGNRKPTGLLQTYADDVRFGLITGSYNKNVSGGVLRKNISDVNDELDADTGRFLDVPGIIRSINALRIYGYRYDIGTYQGSDGDNCTWQLTDIDEGDCTSWGNPLSEMFLETLRYFADVGPTSAFVTDDSNRLSDLTNASWDSPPPQTEDNWCASLNAIVFNASVTSYDGDQLSGFGDLPGSGGGLAGYVNNIGTREGLTGNVFIGDNGTVSDLTCSPKNLGNLADAEGICPEAPTLEGTYNVSGLAHYARTNDLRPDLTGDQLLNTYAVALSPAVPKIEIDMGNDRQVSILPAYVLEVGGEIGAGSLVDFKIVEKTATTGKYYINWEDSEQGGDYDQDVWGVLEYRLIGTAPNYSHIEVTTDVIDESTANPQGFGYVISGTTQDGFRVHSGIRGFDNDPNNDGLDADGVTACNNCQLGNPASSHTYEAGGASAKLLEQPLYYAAKYGNFKEDEEDQNDLPDQDFEWDNDGDGIPDSYFFVTDPSKLVAQLSKVLDAIVKTKASAASVAANSTSLQAGTVIYQSQFNSGSWEGELRALNVSQTGEIGGEAWVATEKLANQNPLTGRNIITYDPTADSGDGSGIPFRWASLNATQQALLNTNPISQSADGRGPDRLDYLRGVQEHEVKDGDLDDIFRNRDTLLGDIVSSAPVYFGDSNFPFNVNKAFDDGGPETPYKDFQASVNGDRNPILYVGANDGMLHAFDADTGTEVMAYVPNLVFENLTQLTSVDYTHRFYVDGQPTIVDAFFDDTRNKEWRTVLVSSLRAGGKGMFALDVTEPDQFREGNAGDLPLWEFSSADDQDLGYTFGEPSVMRMANGEWAAVFGNGYESANHRAMLFIVDVETGELIRKIDTGVGTAAEPNGLSEPLGVDVDGDVITDYIYAGDLHGNLWKIDVRDEQPVNWDFALSQGGSPVPLFVANDGAAGNNAERQPITTAPRASPVRGEETTEELRLYFGTGKYFESGDMTDLRLQTYYGVVDEHGANKPVTRDDLLVQAITTEGINSSNREVRTVSYNSLQPAHKGWLIDLESPANGLEGERVVFDTALLPGEELKVLFSTLIPSTVPCDAGGTGWIMLVNAENGSQTTGSVFDTNNDGAIDGDDEYGNEVVNGMKAGGPTGPSGPGGGGTPFGIPTAPTVVTGGAVGGASGPPLSSLAGVCDADNGGSQTLSSQNDKGYVSGSGGEVEGVTIRGTRKGRLYWQQLK